VARRAAAQSTTPYVDRDEAGRALAGRLHRYVGRDDIVVLGLPRGGVPVAAQVAAVLGAPLDVLVVRKLGLPDQAELAMGAIAGVGDTVEVVRNEPVLAGSRTSDNAFDVVYRREVTELHRREEAYRGGRPALPIRDKAVILVDDGLATGSTMRAAAAAVRKQQAARVVVAVPVAARATCARLRNEVDEVVCPWTPEPFYAVGQAYLDFSATSDDEVRELLANAGRG
jgi:putative phosphoribosyl transferase